jgi:hypothetical protein
VQSALCRAFKTRSTPVFQDRLFSSQKTARITVSCLSPQLHAVDAHGLHPWRCHAASPPRSCSPPPIAVDLPLTLLSRADIDTRCAIQQFTMLYSSVIVAAAFAGFAAAQNSTVIPCCTVPLTQVPQDTRQSWCDAQENTCVDLCGGQGDIASNGNTCDAVSSPHTGLITTR